MNRKVQNNVHFLGIKYASILCIQYGIPQEGNMVQRKKSAAASSRSAAARNSKKAPAAHRRSSSMMSARKSTKAGSRSN